MLIILITRKAEAKTLKLNTMGVILNPNLTAVGNAIVMGEATVELQQLYA